MSCEVMVTYKSSPRPFYFKVRGYPTAQHLLHDFQRMLGDEIKRLCLYRNSRLVSVVMWAK